MVTRADWIVAAVPGFEVPSLIGLTATVPFGEYGFPLIDDEDEPVLGTFAESIDRFETMILKETRWTGTTGYSAAGFGGVGTGICLQLDVDRSFETVRNGSFMSRARRNVRKARDSGLRVTEPDLEGAIAPYYRLYLTTMRRLGSPPFPIAFFRALRRELGDHLTLLLAWQGDDPVAGLLAFEYGDRYLIWGNVSMAEAWATKPNDLLYAEIIRRACEGDATVVDFGRNERGSTVHTFKKQFGGKGSELTSLVYPPGRTNAASIEGYKRLAPVTRRLAPLIANRTVGPWLKWWIHE